MQRASQETNRALLRIADRFYPTMPEDFIMAVGSARPMDDAARMAYRDLICWMVSDYGFDESKADFLCTQAGRTHVGNMVDPKYSLGAFMLKIYLG